MLLFVELWFRVPFKYNEIFMLFMNFSLKHKTTLKLLTFTKLHKCTSEMQRIVSEMNIIYFNKVGWI